MMVEILLGAIAGGATGLAISNFLTLRRVYKRITTLEEWAANAGPIISVLSHMAMTHMTAQEIAQAKGETKH